MVFYRTVVRLSISVFVLIKICKFFGQKNVFLLIKICKFFGQKNVFLFVHFNSFVVFKRRTIKCHKFTHALSDMGADK